MSTLIPLSKLSGLFLKAFHESGFVRDLPTHFDLYLCVHDQKILGMVDLFSDKCGIFFGDNFDDLYKTSVSVWAKDLSEAKDIFDKRYLISDSLFQEIDF
jgi:hypothetical protein